MAVDIERSFNCIPSPTLDPHEERTLLNDAAKGANGGRNVWTEGLKEMLAKFCEPKELIEIIAPLENQEMLSLVHVLERRWAFITVPVITPDIVYEAGIPIQTNLPS